MYVHSYVHVVNQSTGRAAIYLISIREAHLLGSYWLKSFVWVAAKYVLFEHSQCTYIRILYMYNYIYRNSLFVINHKLCGVLVPITYHYVLWRWCPLTPCSPPNTNIDTSDSTIQSIFLYVPSPNIISVIASFWEKLGKPIYCGMILTLQCMNTLIGVCLVYDLHHVTINKCCTCGVFNILWCACYFCKTSV